MNKENCTEVCFQKNKTIAVFIITNEEANELIKINDMYEIHNGTFIKHAEL